jgi:hypothetical protein
MNQAVEVPDLSGRELDSLRVYKGSFKRKNADLDELAKEYGNLNNKRKAAYVRFQKLAGIKD